MEALEANPRHRELMRVMGGWSSLSLLNWPLFGALGALLGFSLVALIRRRRGQPVPTPLCALAMVTATAVVLAGLRDFLSTFDIPSWSWFELWSRSMDAWTILCGALLASEAIRHYRSNVYGDKVPGREFSQRFEENDLVIVRALQSFGYALVFWCAFLVIGRANGFVTGGLLGALPMLAVLCAVFAVMAVVPLTVRFWINRLRGHRDNRPNAPRTKSPTPLTVGWLAARLTASYVVLRPDDRGSHPPGRLVTAKRLRQEPGGE